MQLIHGQKVGQHKVIEYIGTSAFGEAYSVIFGSTNRKYALHIIPEDSNVTVDALNEHIKKVRKLQSPCIIKCFAAGESDGVRWIRTERPTGLKQIHLFTDINCQTSEEKNNKLVFDLDSLIAESTTTGGLAGDDCSLVLYDVLETVSNLHAYDLYVGSAFSNPLLDKQLNPVGVVTRVPCAMWPEQAEAYKGIALDIVEAGRLIEKVANAASPNNRNWANAKPALLELASKAKNLDGYDAVCQLYLDVLDIFSKNGIKYYQRCSVEDFIPSLNNNTHGEEDASEDNTENKPEVSANAKKIHSHKHRHKSAFSKQRRHSSHKNHDAVNRQMMRNSKFVLMMLFLVGCCAGIAYFLYQHEQDSLINQTMKEESAYSAISIIGEDENNNDKSRLPALVEEYTVDQLISNKLINPLAAARYSIMLWFGQDGVEKDREEAVELVERYKSYYDEQYKYDTEIEFWRAYLMLAGVGYEPQRIEAETILDKLANGNMPKASLLLGDLYAQKTTGESKDNDARAMNYWRLTIKAEYGFNPRSVQAMNRILYFVSEGRGMPKEKEYPILFNAIERFAGADHVPSQLVLARLNYEGRYVQKDYSNAVKWYRRIANNTRVHYVLRADAMVNLGTMFLLGYANQSNEAAYHWYERAAELGDAIAMNKLVELYLKEVPREFTSEDERMKAGDADYWKKKSEGVDIIEIKGVSEPSYIVFTDAQMQKFKQPKPMPITVRIHYAGTRENPRTTEIKEIFSSVKVVKKTVEKTNK